MGGHAAAARNRERLLILGMTHTALRKNWSTGELLAKISLKDKAQPELNGGIDRQ